MLEPEAVMLEPEPAQRGAAVPVMHAAAVMLEPANATCSPAAVSESSVGPVLRNWPAVEVVLQQVLQQVLV